MFWQIAADVVIHIAVIAAILATGIITYVCGITERRKERGRRMKNKEAIKHLEFMAKGYQNLLDNDERCLEAVGKGYKGEVEAQESLADVYKAQIDALNMAIKALEQQPCEDAISREEAFKELRKVKYSQGFCAEHNIDDSINLEMANIVISNLPSVQPKDDVLETIHEEIQKEKEGITFNLNEEKARWTNGGIYDGLTWAQKIIDMYKDKGVEE